MFWVRRERRLPLTIGLIVLLAVAGVILAHARGPAPAAGATYTGTAVIVARDGQVLGRPAIGFRIASGAHQVLDLSLATVPVGCGRGRAGDLRLGSARAAIGTSSHFHLSVPITRAGEPVGRLLVSGVFHTLGREAGAVASRFTAGALTGCDAAGGYSTKAVS